MFQRKKTYQLRSDARKENASQKHKYLHIFKASSWMTPVHQNTKDEMCFERKCHEMYCTMSPFSLEKYLLFSRETSFKECHSRGFQVVKV